MSKTLLQKSMRCLFYFAVGSYFLFSCGSSEPPLPPFAPPVLFSDDGMVIGITASHEMKQWDIQNNIWSVVRDSIPTYQKAMILPDRQHFLLLSQTEAFILSSHAKEPISSLLLSNLGPKQDPIAWVWLGPEHFFLFTKQGVIQKWKQGVLIEQTSLQARADLLPMEQAWFSQDGTRLLTLQSGDTVARVWEVQTGKLLSGLGGKKASTLPLVLIAFSGNGKTVVTVDSGGAVLRWDFENPSQPKSTIVGGFDEMPATSIALSKDASLVAIGGQQGAVVVFRQFPVAAMYPDENHPEYGLWRRFLGHQASVQFLAFSPFENQLMSSSQDQKIKVWSTEEDKAMAVLPSAVWAQFSADGNSLFVAPSNRTIEIYATDSLKQPKSSFLPISVMKNGFVNYQDGTLSSDGGRYFLAKTNCPYCLHEQFDIWDVFDVNQPKRVAHLLSSQFYSPGGATLFSKDGQFLFAMWLDRLNSSQSCISLGVWDLYTIPTNPEESPKLSSLARCLLPPVGLLSSDGMALSEAGDRLFVFGHLDPSVHVVHFSSEDGLIPVGVVTSPEFTDLEESFGPFLNHNAKSFRLVERGGTSDELVLLSDANIFQVWNIKNPQTPILQTAMDFSQSPIPFLGSALQMDVQTHHLLMADQQNHVLLLDPKTYQIKSSLIHPVFVEPKTQSSYRLIKAGLSPKGDQGFLLLAPPTFAPPTLALWHIPSLAELANIDVN